MADEQNNYFEFLDIPDGNGGTERWYASDAEARAAIAQLDPASVINVSDITALTQEQCEGLVAGGAVNKSDSTGKHAYKVTFRSDTGMCLTYADAENVETVSYDKVEGTWTYNSTDITPISRVSQVPNKADKVSGATNNHLAALNSNGNLKDSGKSVDDFATAEQGDKADEAYDAIGYDTNGAEFVDLGLPSGTLWAKCNVGATAETGYGNYYMYGKGASQYDAEDTPYDGTEDPLDAQYDTAVQVMGGAWHMPTKAQFEELINNTTYTWETDFNDSGINGGKFTAANGNYVFFPAAGLWFDGELSSVGSGSNYWCSTPYDSSNAYHWAFNNSIENMAYNSRKRGCPVRGVMSKDDLHLNQLRFATEQTCRDIISELT